MILMTTSSNNNVDNTLLQQVLAQFGASPMLEEVVARIEEETPEVPAKYDPATYEYDE